MSGKAATRVAPPPLVRSARFAHSSRHLTNPRPTLGAHTTAGGTPTARARAFAKPAAAALHAAGRRGRSGDERTLAETTVRVQSPQGPAQFVVDQTPDQVEQQLGSFVRVEST